MDKFGYSSHHIVAGLDRKRLSLPEFKKFQALKSEFQIRTVLQHAWAVLDWQFRYKSTEEAPSEVRRKLYRISAFLEGADENFSEVHASILQLRSEYREKLSSGDLDISLNTESLTEFFSGSEALKSLMAHFLKGGFVQENKDRSNQTYSKTLKDLELLGVSRLSDLEQRILAIHFDPAVFANILYQEFQGIGGLETIPLSYSGLIRLVLLVDATDDDFELILPQIFNSEQLIDIMRSARKRVLDK